VTVPPPPRFEQIQVYRGLILHQYAGPYAQSLLLDGLLLGHPHGAAATLIIERADEPWPAHRAPGT
jgi:hypothetical protein